MLFSVHSADATFNQDTVPDADVSVRIEHHYTDSTGQKRTLYLHNSELRKPRVAAAALPSGGSSGGGVGGGGSADAASPSLAIRPSVFQPPAPPSASKAVALSPLSSASSSFSPAAVGSDEPGSVIVTSHKLVFSTKASAQDIFKLMRVGKPEQATIGLVKALRRSCNLYSFALKNPRVAAASDDDVKRLVKAILLAIIDLQHRGTSSHPDIDCTCHRHPIESKRISNHIPCKKNRDQEGKWHDACGVQQSLRRIAGQFCSAHLSRHEINGRGF